MPAVVTMRRMARWPLESPLNAMRVAVWPLLLVLVTMTIADNDIWGHIRFGLDMIAARAVPERDSYSFLSGQAWINHEWGAQVILGLVYRARGASGLVMFKTLVALFGLGLVAYRIRHLPILVADGLLVGVALIVAPMTAQIRPQLFSLVAVVCLLVLLRGRRAWLAVPLFAVWANLHGGWLLGLVILACWVAVSPTYRKAALLLACFVATLCTPFGVHLWISLADAIGRGWGGVREWESALTHPVVLVTWTAITGLLISRVKRADRFTIVTGAVLAALAFRSLRLIPLYGVATVILMADTWQQRPQTPLPKWSAAGLVVVAALWVGVLAISVPLIGSHFRCIPMGASLPEPDAACVVQRLHGRMVTWFDYGLFAIWHSGPDLKVSLDGRRETVYADDVVRIQQEVAAGRRDAVQFCDSTKADFAWYPNASPAAAELRHAGWTPIFQGVRSVILSRPSTVPIKATNPRAISCFPDLPGDDCAGPG